MHSFAYHRPTRLADALELLRRRPEARLLAGGHTLLPTMKLRLAAPSDLVDLAGIAGLGGLAREGDRLKVGALATHAEIAACREPGFAALAGLAGLIGDPLVRHRGTIGGSVANNDPAADYPAACLALEAEIHTDRRRIQADDYFKGMFETALAPDEVITALTFARPERAAYEKLRHPASGYAVIGVFVAARGGRVRVAVTGGGAGVFRLRAMEERLERRFAPDALQDVAVSPEELADDRQASAAMRAHLVKVLAGRAVARASSPRVSSP